MITPIYTGYAATANNNSYSSQNRNMQTNQINFGISKKDLKISKFVQENTELEHTIKDLKGELGTVRMELGEALAKPVQELTAPVINRMKNALSGFEREFKKLKVFLILIRKKK